MLWELEHGEAYAWFSDNGREVPAEIQPPKLLPGAGGVLTAFRALHHDRPAAFGVSAIPFTSIDRYAARFFIAADEFRRFHDLIRAMDRQYLDHIRKKTP